MPFTFSHPAVVLPFRYIGKKYFSMTALMVGSVVPDFEYFMRIENRSHFSHTIRGVFWFDIPLGLFLCFVFHNLVKVPLIANSPYELYARTRRYNTFNWNTFFKKNWMKVVYSLLIGILTHLVADKITHKSSNIVSSVPGILETQELIDTPKSIYRVIQITFSIIGLVLCGLTIWQFPVSKQASDYSPNYRYWIVMGSLFVVSLAAILLKTGYEEADLIVCTMSAMLASLLVTSLVSIPDSKILPDKTKFRLDNR